jgi:hypothetical protein
MLETLDWEGVALPCVTCATVCWELSASWVALS